MNLNITASDTHLIRETWSEIKDFGIQNPLIFYDVFFEIAPDARHYFSTDLSTLGKKFYYTIDFIVNNCDKLELIHEEIEDLGRIHHDLNIDKKYYPLVNQAILALLDKQSDNNIDQAKEAWLKVLEHVGTVMQNAPVRKRNRFQALLKRLFN